MLTWVDECLGNCSALFGPVREQAGLDFIGFDREVCGQGGGLASVPVPVGVIERLKWKERDESIERVLADNQQGKIAVCERKTYSIRVSSPGVEGGIPH